MMGWVMVAEVPPLGKMLFISEPYVLKVDSIVVDIHVCFVVVFYIFSADIVMFLALLYQYI